MATPTNSNQYQPAAAPVAPMFTATSQKGPYDLAPSQPRINGSLSGIKIFTIILLIVRIAGEGYLWIHDLSAQNGMFWKAIHGKSNTIACNTSYANQTAVEQIAIEAGTAAGLVVFFAMAVIAFSILEIYAVAVETFCLLVTACILEILHILGVIILAIAYGGQEKRVVAKVVDASIMTILTIVIVVLLIIITCKIRR